MIKTRSIEALKARADILEVIGSYIELKRAGSNYSACCPFHSEKTPSLVVSPTKNIYHCYGCGVGGDSISFIMEYEKLNFPQAIEKLAQIVGFELEYENHEAHQKKARENEIFSQIIDFYHHSLLKNAPLLDYLKNRALSEESIKKFALGYCPASLENILYCDRNRIDKNKLVDLAILGYEKGRYYARFSDRILFPIYAPNGKPVGFGGRSLRTDVAKYINSPQSPLFNKSQLLYGYHQAKEAIYTKSEIIITEGYLDVILLHQVGFRNAVATLGTALTQEHLPLLSRGDPRVILSYDGDRAGISAALRAAQFLTHKEGGVVLFDDGMDPADMVASGRLDALRRKLQNPMPFIEFILRQKISAFDLSQPLQKQKALEDAQRFLHTLTPILQETYRPFVAQLLGSSLSVISTSFAKKSEKSTLDFLPQANNENLILAYIMEEPALLDVALEYVDEGAFFECREGFRALLKGEKSNPLLVSIALNSAIMIPQGDYPARLEGFKKELSVLILRYNYALLSHVQRNPHLSFAQKSQAVKNIKNTILKLKQGELIAYESISTF